MSDIRWLSADLVAAVHEELIDEHGGRRGIRDRGLLDSAMARPRNLIAYTSPTIFDLAAAYTTGIAWNHPFIDGNKRAAFIAAYVFLADNGYELIASEAEATAAIEAVAAGELTEEQLSAWLRDHTEMARGGNV